MNNIYPLDVSSINIFHAPSGKLGSAYSQRIAKNRKEGLE